MRDNSSYNNIIINMKRSRFAKPVGPPCEQWQQWAQDAPKFRSTGNLMHTFPIDTRTEQHMTVEMLPDPLPPVLQQYPLPKPMNPLKGNNNNLLDCDDDDSDDEGDFVDNFTLLAILESQKEAERLVNRSVPTVISVNADKKRTLDKDSPCRTIDPSMIKQSPVSLKGDIMGKHASDAHILNGVKILKIQPARHFNAPEVHREGCI